MCEDRCAHLMHCDGGAPANKFYEKGRLDSAETLQCRTVLKPQFKVPLERLERGAVGQAQTAVAPLN
jgi:sulfatase maturation enzyme AslB (radical SAM superfamily)